MAPVLCSAERKDVADEARKEKGQIWPCSSSPFRLDRISQPSSDLAGHHVLQSRHTVKSILGGLCSYELHYCNGSQIVTALFIYCGNGAGDSGGFVITLCLMFLWFFAVFAVWGKQEAHSSEPNSLWIVQLFSLTMWWDDFIFSSVTKISNPRLRTSQLAFFCVIHCRWSLFRYSAELTSLVVWVFQSSWMEDAMLESLSLSREHHCFGLQPSVPLVMAGFISLLSTLLFLSDTKLLTVTSAETKTIISVQKCFWVKKCVFCGLWLIQKSSRQRDYSFKPQYIFLHIVHQLVSIAVVKPSIPLRCLGLLGL